jgi:hypothetical protein
MQQKLSLINVLQTFKTVTLQFSTDTPCLAAVIPAMDKMHNELVAASENAKYSQAVRAALTIGRNLLNKYYSLTDDSEVYRIAMGTSLTSFDFLRRTNLAC